jgi:NADPH:quinone reductase-like Zn-dependent oxidoreductase
MVAYFHLLQLTDRNIGNSRDTSFEQLIMSETNGRGVDLVLNSLSEEKLQASVRCFAPGGRFLEIGRFDLENNSRLGRFIILFQFCWCNVIWFCLDLPRTNVISVLALFKVSIVTTLWAG